ncbi:hypothetical protein EDC96DRAFT_587380, partial [Choanephora cucurbitarum]
NLYEVWRKSLVQEVLHSLGPACQSSDCCIIAGEIPFYRTARDTMSIESCGVEEGADRASPPMDLNSPMNETPLDFGESYDMSVNDIKLMLVPLVEPEPFQRRECIFNPLLIDVCQECRFAIRDDDTMKVAPQLASLFLNKSFINQPDNFGINCLSRLFKGDYLNQMIERINFLNGAHNLAVALFFDGFNHNQFDQEPAQLPLVHVARELEELQIEGMVVRVGVAQYHQATYRTSLAACAQFVLIDSIRLCVHA